MLRRTDFISTALNYSNRNSGGKSVKSKYLCMQEISMEKIHSLSSPEQLTALLCSDAYEWAFRRIKTD